jgi:hypothetical protein
LICSTLAPKVTIIVPSGMGFGQRGTNAGSCESSGDAEANHDRQTRPNAANCESLAEGGDRSDIAIGAIGKFAG